MKKIAPELKAKATAVIGPNDDDAVAKWLEANARFSRNSITV